MNNDAILTGLEKRQREQTIRLLAEARAMFRDLRGIVRQLQARLAHANQASPGGLMRLEAPTKPGGELTPEEQRQVEDMLRFDDEFDETFRRMDLVNAEYQRRKDQKK
ncbi:MAG TPA: hypothetical protein PLY86_20505 [bacterium]|nr:hypothetical protein [bacterium]